MKSKEFRSPNEWQNFCDFIVRTNRYVLNRKWANFFDIISITAKKRETILEKRTTLVRARIGSYYDEYEEKNGELKIVTGPLPRNELVAPPPQKAKDGRINPRGISYLYLSNNIETAIIEVRPWLGQEVSVGYFEIKNDLKCVDTSQDKKGRMIYLGKGKPKLTPEKKEEYVWGGINSSFSRPVRSEDESINYIPTQYLSEFFKNNGYDGIIYKSALTEEGYNIVLFNPKNGILKGAKVFEIKSIKQTFEECDNPYVCKE
jgi:hypothetical protein